jgi:ABC-type transport system involved in cytochrome c biogenesis permease component
VNFLPIVSRELRVVSRKSWMYWVRSIFALAGVIAALFMFFEGPSNRIARGDPMLWVLSAVTLALAIFCGGLLTADCISSEKRDDTLGLLFLTALKGHDVVIGKVVTHTITAACGLVAVFPVFFLPILAGGVTWAETLRVLLGIVAAFFFALCLGVWISTRSRDGRNAVMATLTAVALLMILPLLWMALLDDMYRLKAWAPGAQLSPAMLIYYARDHWYSGSSAKAVYWITLCFFVAASVVLACLSSLSLPNIWRSTEQAAPKSRKTRWPERVLVFPLRFISGNPFRDLLRRRLVEFRWGRRLRRLAMVFFAGMILFCFVDGDEPQFVFAVMTLFLMHIATKFVMAFDATRAIHDDKRSSALELILATTLTEREIASGHAEAFRDRFKPQIRRLVWMTGIVQFTAMFADGLHIKGNDLFLFSSFIWGAMIWTWSDSRVAPWFGLEHALTENSQLRATLRTISKMAVRAWLPYFVALIWMAESRVSEEGAGLMTFVWATCAAIYQGRRAAKTRERVIRDFRRLACGDAALPRDGFARSIGRLVGAILFLGKRTAFAGRVPSR